MSRREFLAFLAKSAVVTAAALAVNDQAVEQVSAPESNVKYLRLNTAAMGSTAVPLIGIGTVSNSLDWYLPYLTVSA